MENQRRESWADSADPSERTRATKQDEYRMHIEFWRHFDTLRQQKNGAFLAAQGFLIAAFAFATESESTGSLDNAQRGIVVVVSVFGFVLGLAWLTLLVRNGRYIRFHQCQARQWEKDVLHDGRSMLTKQKGAANKGWWKPANTSSLVIDRMLPIITICLWMALPTIVLLAS
jgi:hypothetical protein